MIQIEQIKRYFPPSLQNNLASHKYMLKEYLQLLILEYLSSSEFIRNLTFIGGTNLRLVKGIDRFSEDLDFDCSDLSEKEFYRMSSKVLQFLRNNGWQAERRENKQGKLKAYRSSIYFPNLLFNLGLSGHKEARFLIKLESQDQQIDYRSTLVNIKGCGFFFPFPVPSDKIMCSMKIAAMLDRQKGRDFYDVMFLLSQTQPDYTFLEQKFSIRNLEQLKEETHKILEEIDLNHKKRDFEHLLFNKRNSDRILRFSEFMEEL